jgi:uncharacterized protein YbaP (TraB family)
MSEEKQKVGMLTHLPKDEHLEFRIKAMREGKSIAQVLRELALSWLHDDSDTDKKDESEQ